METNDRKNLIDAIADGENYFQEHGYYPTTHVPRPAGKPKQEACEDPECYHNFPERIIFRDIQRGTVPDEALQKSCCWSKICEVRGKHRYKIRIHSDTWLELCSRMGSIRYRRGWISPRVASPKIKD